MVKELIIKENILGKNFDYLPEKGNLPYNISDIIINAKESELNLNAMKVILILVANLKERQIREKYQLDLFDNDWFNIDNTNSHSVVLSFKFSNFLPKGNKNYNSVKLGLSKLQEFSREIKFEKTDENGILKKYILKSSLISDYILEEGKGFKITINNFWYRTLLNRADINYNPYLIKSTIKNIDSGGQMRFLLYLKTLPKIVKKDNIDYEDLFEKIGDLTIVYKGTTVKWENFLNVIRSSYKYESDVIRKYLNPWRSDFNKNSDISFNYKIIDGKIYIVAYETNNNLIAEKEFNDDIVSIRNAINYKVSKYNLSTINSYMLIELYIKYTYDLVFKVTNKNKLLRNLNGDEYFNAFSNILAEHCRTKKINLENIEYKNKKEIREFFKKIENNKKEKLKNK